MIVVKLSLVCEMNCNRLLSGDNTFSTSAEGSLGPANRENVVEVLSCNVESASSLTNGME